MALRDAPRRLIGILALAVLMACDRTPPEVERPPTAQPSMAPSGTSAAADSTAASAALEPAPAPPGEGDAKIPFDFPQLTMPAKPGDYLLAPPRAWIDAGLEKGGDKQTFIYYGGWMKQPGPAASLIETLPGQPSVIPNALIVAIPRGQRVTPGELVLTTWASGTGMQRAIVVPGGTPESPSVRYLDMSLSHPTGWGKREDRLPPNTFKKLSQAGEVGTTAACKEGAHHMRYIITAKSGKRLLGYGFAGKIAAFDEDACQPLPLTTRAREGDWIEAPVAGRYTRVKVQRVDRELGRVVARYKLDDESEVVAFATLDVALGLSD